MKNIDISNIAQENYDYAVHLAIHQQLLSYKNGMFNLDRIPQKDPFETIDLWRDLSLSIEILLKFCLLTHHIPFFKKRAHGEYGNKVTALDNPWLKETLENRLHRTDQYRYH